MTTQQTREALARSRALDKLEQATLEAVQHVSLYDVKEFVDRTLFNLEGDRP